MLARSFLVVIGAAIIAVSMPLPKVSAADAQRPDTEQARIEQTYASKLKAEQQALRNQAVVNQTNAVFNDPMTQIIGNANGDVAVVEFFDYTCPFCKAAEPRLRKLLQDDKNVKLIVKEFPILTPESVVASKAALASVKQGKYTAFHNAMMDFRGQLRVSTIFDIAKDVGLDVERLRKDMNAPEIADEIIANFNLARALKVTTTPEFIIGKQVIFEASGKIDFPKAVAEARAK